MEYYCVISVYKAGGAVRRDVVKVISMSKPVDSEKEMYWETTVKKYFDTEDEASKYIKVTSL